MTYRRSLTKIFIPFFRSEVNINYFNQTQTVALTVFGIAAGGALIYIRRAKVCVSVTISLF